MKPEEMLHYVDHTLLKPTATWAQIEELCTEGLAYGVASVCIPPCYVKRVADQFGKKLPVCTVIGFPLGYSKTVAKVAEARQALEDGADEIDMVINQTDVKNGDFQAVEDEIALLKKTVGQKILKVIIETCHLTREEKIQLCVAVTNAKADYIKTSTGFGSGGATLEDIQLFRQHIGPQVKIKAAGGVKTIGDMEAFINAGCSRIGTSSAVKLVHDEAANDY